MSLLQMSVYGAVMIGAVIIIRALTIHRLPKRTFLALWGIVLLRLLLPFSIPSPLSLYSVIKSSPAAGQMFTAPTVGFVPMPPTSRVGAAAADIAFVPPAAVDPEISPWVVLWAVGAAVCAAYFAIAYIKCRREFLCARPVENDLAALWLGEHGTLRRIQIRQSQAISAPLTYGILHPVILLPVGIDWSGTSRISYILEHEYIHIRRFDAAAKILLTAALCIHWFNPMVWCMYLLANRDMELSCDEGVVCSFGAAVKSAYALALIGMEEKKSGLVPFGSSFSKNAIEERITAIMKMRKTTALTLAIALVIVIGTTTVFATSAEDKQIQPSSGNLTSSKAEASHDEEYKKWGIEQKDGAYYYKNERVRIFMDMRADNSFVTFSYDEKQGSIDIRLLRDISDSIVKIEYIPQGEAAALLSDLDAKDLFASASEDIQRLNKEEISAEILAAVNDCTDGKWYVIESEERQYIYYSGLPHDFAFQYEQSSSRVKIVDIGDSAGRYLLLSVPKSPELTVSYNSQPVELTTVPEKSATSAPESGFTAGVYGKYTLSANDKMEIDAEWAGSGRYMALLTNKEFTKEEISTLAQSAILPIGTSQNTVHGELAEKVKGTQFVFSVSGEGALKKTISVPSAATYYLYTIAEADCSGVTGTVTVGNKSIDLASGSAESIQNQSGTAAYSSADAVALDIMQRTGNWGYIEAYLPQMTNAGIDKVTASYNSKHPNIAEHKNAADYYN